MLQTWVVLATLWKSNYFSIIFVKHNEEKKNGVVKNLITPNAIPRISKGKDVFKNVKTALTYALETVGSGKRARQKYEKPFSIER